MLDIEFHILHKRIHRWLSTEHNVQRRVTHVAQNTQYNSSVIEEFGVSPDSVVNIDETSIQFDMTSSVTLTNLGSRTVSL